MFRDYIVICTYFFRKTNFWTYQKCYPSKKNLTWLAGKHPIIWIHVFPIEHGDFPACHVSELRGAVVFLQVWGFRWISEARQCLSLTPQCDDLLVEVGGTWQNAGKTLGGLGCENTPWVYPPVNWHGNGESIGNTFSFRVHFLLLRLFTRVFNSWTANG